MKKRIKKQKPKFKTQQRKPSNKSKDSKLRKLKAYQKGQRMRKKNRSIVHKVLKRFKRK